MKRGFTLIELISAITLLALILLLAVPAIVNQLSEKKNELSDTTLKILYNAAELYMDDNNVLSTLEAGDTYCVSLDRLVQDKYLKSPIKDVNTGGEIALTKKVKVTINSNLEYDKYILVDKCE